MHKRSLRPAALAFAAFGLVAACGGSPSASGLPTAPPLPSGLPSFAIPSFTLPSFAIPSFPSFAPDPAIEGAFPSTIAGQPVTDVSSANFLSVLQGMGMDQTRIADFVGGMQSIGVDPAAVGFGSGTITLDDEEISLQLVRFPGGNAGAALEVLTRIDEPENPPVLTTETIGGKSVTVATNPDGDIEYFYVNGEMAWFLDSVERSQAETIFAELP